MGTHTGAGGSTLLVDGASDGARTVFEGTELRWQGAATDGTFTVVLDERWLGATGMHGGYQAALGVRAAELAVPDRAVRTVSTGFQRTGRPGPATLVVREVRRGRLVSNVLAELVQDGATVLSSRITMLADTPGAAWGTRVDLDLPPVELCVAPDPPMPVPHFERAHGLLDPSSLPFSGGPELSVRGYVRPLDGPVDAPWLVMICDWFPPPAFVRMAPPVGARTVDMVTHLHRIGTVTPGWLQGRFDLAASDGGLATEHGRVVAPDGRLLAESLQTRWTALDA